MNTAENTEFFSRLRQEEHFLLLKNGPDGNPVCYIGEHWETTTPDSIPGAEIGLCLSYELNAAFEKLPDAPPVRMDLPALMVLQPREVLRDFSVEEVLYTASEKGGPVVFQSRFSKEEYLESVRSLQAHIRRGDIYEVNFCMDFFAENVKLDPFALFPALYSITKAPFSAFLRRAEQFLICGSPERFLKREKNRLISQPIKGTIRRGKTNEEDERLREQLKNDPKERSENVMIVDLVRNDLSRIAKKSSVNVDELMGIYSFPTVHQMISTISCEVSEETKFNSILAATFPMGSMTGAPKVRAMELIAAHERSARGWYSGSVGYLRENGDFDLNVVIRSLVYDRQNQYLSFSVGSAITAASDPEREYEECLLKAEAMREAVNRLF